MSRLTVSVQDDHLDGLVKGPLAAVSELIWNALDADATEVLVTTESNSLGGTESVVIADNGSGISPEQADREFGNLGGSWKKTVLKTQEGRVLHGRFGRGRWAAYGLGSLVDWTSITESDDGTLTELVISGRQSALKEFQTSEPLGAEPGATPGTVVTVRNVHAKADAFLSRDDVINDLTSVFALYLSKYPATVGILGTAIDPEAAQQHRAEIPLEVEGVSDEVTLTIIEWKMTVERALHICDETGVSLNQMPPGIQAPGFSFTAYLKWTGFREHYGSAPLSHAEAPLPQIMSAAKDAMRTHFKERTDQRGNELVQSWKDDRTYPYEGEPTGQFERSERELFNVVALAAAPAVENVDRRSRKLSLRLLRETLETSPESLHSVLAEVLVLPETQREELRQLLERTSFGAVIASARAITDRLDFLAGLEAIVFDPVLKKKTKERSQLHRILAKETWIFREEYALTADDNTLTTALKAHTGLLGREDLAPEELEAGEVLDLDGNRAVVDLMLSRVIEHHADHREHVVIELKRPSVHIGNDELAQITKYANTVANDPRFAATDTRWEFWIVGDVIKDELNMMINQANREPGVAVDYNNTVVRVVTWASIIQAARHRLNFVKHSLDYAATTEGGMDYLHRTHEKYLPSERPASDAA
ncbi:ATP-binding protein [Glycomyces sp. NRRL B-16210]|uniref:ATP-binding protein n=1 Tax=Glycomyces sp. NRRL B-16210 TaxID=1463821 RepID=UPI00068C88E7|nr:ATP-binding protein [Glycomyces sp. NRRL B-16210]